METKHSEDHENPLVSQGAVQILFTEEDKTGLNIHAMSNFLEKYHREMRSELEVQIKKGLSLDTLPAYLGIAGGVSGIMQGIIESKTYYADFASLSKEVRQGLRDGTYTMGKSQEVAGNMAASIHDKNGNIVANVTLKGGSVIAGAAIAALNITTQIELLLYLTNSILSVRFRST